MAIAPDQFWRSNHYKHPPLTDEMVAEAERQLGAKLPAEYLTLLRVQNGGYTHGFEFPMSRPPPGPRTTFRSTTCSGSSPIRTTAPPRTSSRPRT